MSLFLRFKDNDEKHVEVIEEEGSDLKYFEDKAGELHTEVDQINEVLAKSMFHIRSYPFLSTAYHSTKNELILYAFEIS